MNLTITRLECRSSFLAAALLAACAASTEPAGEGSAVPAGNDPAAVGDAGPAKPSPAEPSPADAGGAKDSAANDAAADDAAGDDAAADDAAIASACDLQFTAMLTRHGSCSGASPVPLAIDAADRANYAALCMAQSKAPGTGYTPEFRRACAAALTGAACDDLDTVVKACWIPRGQLARGADCANDDQCASGYCALPDGGTIGSSCGTCQAPVWVDEYGNCAAQYDRCRPGLACAKPDYNNPPECMSFSSAQGSAEGGSCGLVTTCARGLFCKSNGSMSGSCEKATIAPIGHSCDGEAVQCQEGASCREHRCLPNANLGEACDDSHDHPACRDFLVCSGTHRCERADIMSCS